jgi:threonine synthase
VTSYVTHLESALDGTHLPAHTLQTTYEGRPIVARYDLERIRAEVDRDALVRREPTMWRYRELLPPKDDANVVTLGEGMTPLLPAPRLGARFGLSRMLIKDEGQLPTGSFKSRGQSACISMAKELGQTAVVVPTAGNAGGAMSAYAARAGMEAHVFMPRDTPEVNRREAVLCGANVHLVDGLIDDCGRIAREQAAEHGWYDVSTLKEPYRLEGKKTMGLEIVEDFGPEKLPQWIIYPTGGGTGLVGIWKALQELIALGAINPAQHELPRMVAVQSENCAPVIEAFDRGLDHVEPVESKGTIADGLDVPGAIMGHGILATIRDSGGTATAVSEGAIRDAFKAMGRHGVAASYESAATLAALRKLRIEGTIPVGARVLLLLTANHFVSLAQELG